MDRPPAETLLEETATDGIRVLTLDRPQRRNALDSALARALIEAVRRADADAGIGAVVIAGNGPTFCAGADLGEFRGERADPVAESQRSDLFAELQLLFSEVRVPTIAAVQGQAVGAGASLAIGADLTLLAEDATLVYPEVRHGMVPSLMIPVLQHRLGRKRAYGLLALAAPLGAAEALALGLVNEVVPSGELMPAALRRARTLAGIDRAALRETKRLLEEMAGMPLGAAVRYAREASRRRRDAPPGAAGGAD